MALFNTFNVWKGFTYKSLLASVGRFTRNLTWPNNDYPEISLFTQNTLKCGTEHKKYVLRLVLRSLNLPYIFASINRLLINFTRNLGYRKILYIYQIYFPLQKLYIIFNFSKHGLILEMNGQLSILSPEDNYLLVLVFFSICLRIKKLVFLLRRCVVRCSYLLYIVICNACSSAMFAP